VTSGSLPIAASLITPRWNGYDGDYDFDVYLLDPSGRVVAKGDSTERQDDLTHRATTTGTHTVRVQSSGGREFFRRRRGGSVAAARPLSAAPFEPERS
jgi:hypothetical protein